MKTHFYFIVLCLVLFLSFNTCKKSNELIEPVWNIKSIDIKEMAQVHLPDFILVRERLYNKLDSEYVFSRNNDTDVIWVVSGICPSSAIADSTLKSYFSYIAGVPQAGAYQGISLGDQLWWMTDGTINSRLTNVYFIRRNIYFSLSAKNYTELIGLAKEIDEDILNKASYIKYRE